MRLLRSDVVVCTADTNKSTKNSEHSVDSFVCVTLGGRSALGQNTYEVFWLKIKTTYKHAIDSLEIDNLSMNSNIPNVAQMISSE